METAHGPLWESAESIRPLHGKIYICIYNTQFLTQSQEYSQTPGNLPVPHHLWFHGLRGALFFSFYFLESSEDGTPTQCRGHKLVLGREEAAVPNPITHWPPNDIALGSCVWTSFWEIDSLIPSTPDTWRTATSPGWLPCRAQLCPTEHGCQEVSHMWNTLGDPPKSWELGDCPRKESSTMSVKHGHEHFRDLIYSHRPGRPRDIQVIPNQDVL